MAVPPTLHARTDIANATDALAAQEADAIAICGLCANYLAAHGIVPLTPHKEIRRC